MLSQYQEDVRDLLRDDYSQFFSSRKINRYINRARKQVALQTGCIRLQLAGASASGTDATVGVSPAGGIIPGSVGNANLSSTSIFSTIAGQEKYPYSYAQTLLRQQYAGVEDIFDVLGVAVSWGGSRPVMAWMPWLDLQAYARATTNGMTSYPLIFSKYMEGTRGSIWLFPTPSIASEMEWDTLCLPIPLVDDSTPEALSYPFTDAVKYYSAHLAYLSSQRFGMAETMLDQYLNHLMVNAAQVNTGAVPDYYQNVGGDGSW